MSALASLARRIQLLVGRAVIRAVEASGGRVALDMGMLDDEETSGVELAEPWGVTSVPLAGAEALAFSVGGERGNPVAISLGDRRHRPRDLQPGETALFDDGGQFVVIRRDRIEIISAHRLLIDAPAIEMTAGSATINGRAIATVGDQVSVGSGSSAGLHPIVTGIGDGS